MSATDSQPDTDERGEVTRTRASRTQRTIARRMTESRATIPEFTAATDVDMEAATGLRARLKAAAGDGEVAPSVNDLVIKACALALRELPRANGAWVDDGFALYSRVNVGVAVAAEQALIVPVVRDADTRPLAEIATDTRALAEKVRARTITPADVSGATFTVTNLGMLGVNAFTAVIDPGQAAILSVGAVREEPVVRDGAVVAGRRMNLTLTSDHRILYGADAAAFLARVRAALEAPESLIG